MWIRSMPDDVVTIDEAPNLFVMSEPHRRMDFGYDGLQ